MRVRRLLQAVENYGNPLGLFLARALKSRLVRVADRRTRLEFRCQRGADRMFGEIFHTRLYDVPSIPVRPGDAVVDIGANHGFATCYFAARGASVTAFEPSPAVFRLLEENVGHNRQRGLLNGNVELHQSAVGSAGSVELLVTEQLGGGMTTTVPGAAIEIAARVLVPSVTLDTVLSAIAAPRIRLVKLDCEGAEEAILANLSPDQRDRVDSWALEFHSVTYDLPALIERLLGWPDYHLSKAAEFGVANANLYLVHKRALLEAAAGDFR